ncbi:MAG: cobalamin biosynthesis protein CbiA [Myxococcota bacterium]|nr:cobalamin biosynthesis protein CbiA [Myxococcota bacterium]
MKKFGLGLNEEQLDEDSVPSMVDDTGETYIPQSNLIIIVGNYGSGKTEVAVNLALYLSQCGNQISIADLDIVNPYFRCREAQALMRSAGIRVVIPPGAHQFADLPIVVPEIKGMLHPGAGHISIFDVGGDDVGATLLSSFVAALGDSDYSLLQVINAKRPFTDTVDGCLKMKSDIEAASRLKVTGFICNTHLIEETTPSVIAEGYALTEQVSRACGLPIELVTAVGDLARSPIVTALTARIFELKRIMAPPWLRTREKPDRAEEKVPAGRTKPIFRP